MKEIILTLLDTIIKAAIPLVVAYLIALLKKEAARAEAEAKTATEREYIAEITNAVATAVSATSQTYVDALKSDNLFNEDAQRKALQQAKSTALSILSPAAKDFLSNVTNDINTYLEAKIEEQVRMQKFALPVVFEPIEAKTTEQPTE